MVKNYKLAYPVFYDLEDGGTVGAQSNSVILDMTKTFCSAIKAAGYSVGTYGNKSWYT